MTIWCWFELPVHPRRVSTIDSNSWLRTQKGRYEFVLGQESRVELPGRYGHQLVFLGGLAFSDGHEVLAVAGSPPVLE